LFSGFPDIFLFTKNLAGKFRDDASEKQGLRAIVVDLVGTD